MFSSPAQALAAGHTRLVAKIAQRYYGKHIPEDALAAGYIGLCEAANLFDPARGNTFITCAWWPINNHVVAHLRKEIRWSRPPAIEKTEAESIERTIAMRQNTAHMLALIDALGVREREIIRRRFFLDEAYSTIGTALGISGEHTRRLEARALAWLRAEMP